MIHELDLVNKKIHFDELHRKIKKAQYEAASASMLGTEPYLIIISDILLNDVTEYSKKIYKALFNQIKLEKCNLLKSDEFVKIIKDNMQNTLEKYLEILKNEVAVDISADRFRQKGREEILKSLLFPEKFEQKLIILCSEYETIYCNFLQKKSMEKISIEASKSSISSKRASWVAIFISISGINLSWIFQHFPKFWHH